MCLDLTEQVSPPKTMLSGILASPITTPIYILVRRNLVDKIKRQKRKDGGKSKREKEKKTGTSLELVPNSVHMEL